MTPKTEVFGHANGNVEVRTTFDAAFIAELQQRLPREVAERAAAALAEKFVVDKGPAIIACIDTKYVLNLAVAKVVTRISEERK